jgi:hypothetical protein
MATLTRRLSTVAVAILITAGLGITGAQHTRAADTGLVSEVQTTRSYKIQLDIGPVVQMMRPDQTKGATSGDVLVSPDTAADSIREQIMPASHHVAVYMHSMQTGAAMMNPTPVLSLRNQDSNRSYTLDELTAVYDVTKGQSDTHYGQNVYLPAGTYDITVWVGRDRTVFNDVSVTGDYIRGQRQG